MAAGRVAKEKMHVSPLKVQAQNGHKLQQVARQVQMIRVGKQTPSLDGMNGEVSLQGGLDIGDE